MNFSVPILPLSTIDDLSYQKCLVPSDKFPLDARPGQWAKCYFSEMISEEQNYAAAQIFPREDVADICYLDACVTGSMQCNNNQKLTLQNIEILQVQKEPEIIDIDLKLNAQYFINNTDSISKSLLYDFAQILLQRYHLTNNCFVRDTYFLDNGIDSIEIVVESLEDNSTYMITDETIVNIRNISLTRDTFKPDLISLDILPFNQARQELINLIKLSHSQRSQSISLNINLNVLVVGPVGCGKTTLVEEFLCSHHCNVFHIEISNCMKQYPGETEAELRKVFKAACDFERKFKSKDPNIILLEEIHLLCPQISTAGGSNSSDALGNSMRISAQLLSLVDELFSTRSNIICLATTSKPDNVNQLVRRPGRFEKEISIATLQEEDRNLILKQLLMKSLPNNYIPPTILNMIAKRTQGYVISDLALLVRKLSQIILTKSSDLDIEALVHDVLNKSKPISLRGSDVTAYRTTITFDSIGGMFKLKKILEISVLAGLKQHESFKRFGLSLPKGVLLYGPPGCGKTTIAKCLATEANMTLIVTSGAEVYSPYVGCAEKFIANIFNTARKNSPCLIFLDEIDALVGRRSLTGSSGNIQVRILSTLLTEMDGIISSTPQNSPILVVAATNRPDMVDDALLRPGRFDKLIHVPVPDLLSRRSILALYEQKMPFSSNIDLDCIAARTENYSGVDVCNLCNEAAMHAFQRDFNTNEILMEDFESVLKTSKVSLTQSQIDWYYKFENKFTK